jgi:hypothetical protein
MKRLSTRKSQSPPMFKVNFKYPHLADEWRHLLTVNPKLVYLALQWCDNVGGEITITEIWRNQETQGRYYPGSTTKSVHQFWRGIDIRIATMGIESVKSLAEDFNAAYPYDPARPKMDTFMVHDVGQGLHLHIQTADGGKA